MRITKQMKLNKYKVFSLVGIIAVAGCLFVVGHHFIFASSATALETAAKSAVKTPAVPAPLPGKMQKPKYIRGIHLTSWVAGSSKMRPIIDQLMDQTELNTVVIDVKEYEGEVYLPGVKLADENKAYVKAIPDVGEYVKHLKSRGIYPVARIVVFKDGIMPRRKPSLGVKNTDGGLWKDRKGITWLDPYNKEVWSYNLDVAERAVDLGFEEIQFDYIRFPSDGNIGNCRYSQAHSSITSSAALVGFLKEAHRRLKPRGVDIGIDVFGLTTTVQNDMGIGQKLIEMSEWVDYVCPMVYPSHYAKGEFRIPDPNKAPYKTVYLSMEGAKKKLGVHASKIRPYLQDFSLGCHYGAKEVRTQIQATYDNDIGEWLLWNPRCIYTRGALLGKEAELTYEKKPLPEEIVKHLEIQEKEKSKKLAQTQATALKKKAVGDKAVTSVTAKEKSAAVEPVKPAAANIKPVSLTSKTTAQ
jgi:hypothetical protein